MSPLHGGALAGRRRSDLALAAGMAETRATLAAWRRAPAPVLTRWFALSLAIALALLAAIWIVSGLTTPDPMTGLLPGIRDGEPATAADLGATVLRNLTVLALHSLACVAGFIAGSSMPLEARARGGRWGAVHDAVGRFAILFVTAATLFSLTTQAYVLGGITADVAALLDIGRAELLLLLAPHAVPELTGLFLPLAAWLLASRRGAWGELLAATAVTTAIALPIVLGAALLETYVTPEIIRAVVGA